MQKLIVHNETKEMAEALSRIMEENSCNLELVQSGETRYADSLGWLDTGKWAGEEQLSRLEELAADIQAQADAFVLIGVGGSNNAARSVIEALRREDAPEIIYAGNTLSAHAIAKMLLDLEGKRIVIDCIAKNFETLEPGSAFRILRQYLENTCGGKAGERIIATGTKGSRLEQLCTDNGYTFLEFPLDIGGRYTAISAVGLLPMAAAGIDIRELVRGAHDMQLRLRSQGPLENPAYRYACLRNLYYRNGCRVEMLSGFEPRLRWFYKWWIQLFAESEGKENKGIFPVSGEFSEELHSVGQFLQEGSPLFFETFLDVMDPGASVIVPPDDTKDGFSYLEGKDFRDINRAAYEATVKAHSQKFPCLTLELECLDAYHFGELFYFFEFACVVSCYIMGVPPFNQPGVEAYKEGMFKALGKKIE